MKRFFTVLCLVFVVTAQAQTKSASQSPSLTEGSPDSVGMSAERLARIDKMCEQAVSRGVVPGVVALVARHGTIVYHKAFGLADNATKRELKPDDIFRIASQTKAVTATAVMTLWEEGAFKLDDPISKFIPEFKDPKVLKTYTDPDNYTTEPAKPEITIRHLITHTSGLGYGYIDSDEHFKAIYKKAGIVDAFSAEPVKLADNVKKLAKLPLHHNPGEKFTYSEGLDVLGYLVEIISGMPFDQYLKTHLFEPLGMNDTAFYLPDDKASRLVPVQTPKDGNWVHQPITWYDPDFPIKGAKSFFPGGAGLCSTALDYASFLQMYINGGELNGTRLLSRTTVESILANQTGELMSGKNGDHYYGLVFGVVTPEGQAKGGKGSVGTFDWGGYFNTSYFADPQEQLIGILFKQTEGAKGDDTGDIFRQLVFAAIDD